MKKICEVDSSYQLIFDYFMDFFLDKESVNNLMLRAIDGHDPGNGEFQIVTAKGTYKWVNLRVGAVFESGVCMYLFGTLEDVTDRVSLTLRLAERDQQFHHAFNYAPIGMALVSPAGEWIRVNKNVCLMLGYDESEFLRTTFQDITHPDDLDADLQQMYDLLDDKIDSYQMDKRYFHKNGSIIWVSLSVTLVRDQQRKPLYFVSQIVDITERVKTMEVISAQNSRLLNFAYIVSHNLRSHSGNIQILADMIAKETDLVEKEELIKMLSVSALNLQETLGNLNEVVDIDAGTAQKMKHLNLESEIVKTISTLSVLIKDAGAIVDINIDTKIEIRYNPTYLESVILNLLTNSLRYRDPARTPQIAIKAHQKPNKAAVLEIQDNGMGIDLDLYGRRIFGMYETFHGNKDANGIGLFLVKNQVEAMGGNVSVESYPGKGTKFRIELGETMGAN
ncbi:MAG TPA: PAS domain S-box protein [Mucilaginibacter sp.]